MIKFPWRRKKTGKFSDYLPYKTFDDKTVSYDNHDCTTGYIWECQPLVFASEKTTTILESLFRLGLDPDSVLQFILYSDDQITPYLERYQALRSKDNEILAYSVDKLCEYYEKGRGGFEKIEGIPCRNLRLFVALKMPTAIEPVRSQEICDTVTEILYEAKLYPRQMDSQALTAWLRQLFSGVPASVEPYVSAGTELNRQAIPAGTEITATMNSFRVNGRSFHCLAPKAFPREVDPIQTNTIFGGIFGVVDDGNQVKTPFLYSLNICYGDNSKALHAKCNLILQSQDVLGTFSPNLQRKREEFLWAVDQLERGEKFVKIVPTMWVWDQDANKAMESAGQVQRLWERQGYLMKREKGILSSLFIASLPFGLYNSSHNMEIFYLDFIVPTQTAVNILPIQADFAGFGEPHNLFLGRKGQVCTLDLFDRKSNWPHLLATGSAGSGKTTLFKYMLTNYFAAGARIRILDPYGSYRHISRMMKGKNYRLMEAQPVSLNPFTKAADLQQAQHQVPPLVLEMCGASQDETVETAKTIIKYAVQWAWEQKESAAGIDDIFEFLVNFPNVGDYGKFRHNGFEAIAQSLALRLKEFTTTGSYGSWFNGPNQLDLAQDDWVAVDTSGLREHKLLLACVTLQAFNCFSGDLPAEPKRKTIVCCDDVFDFKPASPALADTLECCYRVAKANNVGIWVTLRSILDLERLGAAGRNIALFSTHKMHFENYDIMMAHQKNLICADEFTLQLLGTIRARRPHFGEFFLESNISSGMMRLVLDPFNFAFLSTDAKVCYDVDQMVAAGVPYCEAIQALADQMKR